MSNGQRRHQPKDASPARTADGTSQKRTRVCFLPIAGKEDPSQFLKMDAMQEDGRFEVRHGCAGKFFVGTLTCLKHRPVYLHYDWNTRYIIGRTAFITWLKVISFLVDIAIVRQVFKCTIVWCLHNIRSHENSSTIERWMQRRFARACAWIRVFSHSSKGRASQYLTVPEEKIRVLPEASLVGYYPNDMGKEQSRKYLGIDSDAFVLLCLGSMRPYKGIEQLIDAFENLDRPDWQLIIAGRPYIKSYADEIVERAKRVPRISVFPRFIAVEKLQYFYNSSDIVVMPFIDVESSGSLLVAMGFGKAVVAPSLGVIPERLSHQERFLYEPGKMEDVLRRLSKEDRKELSRIGRISCDEVQKYKWEDFVGLFC